MCGSTLYLLRFVALGVVALGVAVGVAGARRMLGRDSAGRVPVECGGGVTGQESVSP